MTSEKSNQEDKVTLTDEQIIEVEKANETTPESYLPIPIEALQDLSLQIDKFKDSSLDNKDIAQDLLKACKQLQRKTDPLSSHNTKELIQIIEEFLGAFIPMRVKFLVKLVAVAEMNNEDVPSSYRRLREMVISIQNALNITVPVPISAITKLAEFSEEIKKETAPIPLELMQGLEVISSNIQQETASIFPLLAIKNLSEALDEMLNSIVPVRVEMIAKLATIYRLTNNSSISRLTPLMDLVEKAVNIERTYSTVYLREADYGQGADYKDYPNDPGDNDSLTPIDEADTNTNDEEDLDETTDPRPDEDY